MIVTLIVLLKPIHLVMATSVLVLSLGLYLYILQFGLQ